MKKETRQFLRAFIVGIPAGVLGKRKLRPDLSNEADFRRLIRVSVCLLDYNDSIESYDIKSICEEVGGDDYLALVEDPQFMEEFANPIFSEIDNAKSIINTYRNILTEKK